MIDKDHRVMGWLSTLVAWALGHPHASWGGITAFTFGLWSSLKDGNGWLSSLFLSFLAVLITLILLEIMKITGFHEDWMPGVGMIIGVVGADRIRMAILGAWEIRKNKLVNKDESEK
ncbi:phage holin family protein [Salmonella bongori]|uniref:phage holin family protein n=1 Tax=Salmonella bongori TaxID=54736 RepID=UPI0015E820DB|nr:phage holin family protein [Salmonella bongori]EEO9371570.1 hypothetical protein [Salmonella bongori]EHU5138491.1 phage holin family protein [Salmonella bongori]EIL5514456.1 phage holin family protein [Salmonella bongori]EIZ4350174.1 phage holin family protein [Salmonella bongori serovar 48:z81:-]EJX9718106.1 phage holin family protein [Salmonella bongori]